MDEHERAIVNRLQGGFPLSGRPFAEAARTLGIDEATLIAKLKAMLEAGTLTRFGPLYDAERLGGAFTLCAMSVRAGDFERVAALAVFMPLVAGMGAVGSFNSCGRPANVLKAARRSSISTFASMCTDTVIV